jgi:hypothetical protein
VAVSAGRLWLADGDTLVRLDSSGNREIAVLLGGLDAVGRTHANALATDSAGNVFAAGVTSQLDFPVTPGFNPCHKSRLVQPILTNGRLVSLLSSRLTGRSCLRQFSVGLRRSVQFAELLLRRPRLCPMQSPWIAPVWWQ